MSLKRSNSSTLQKPVLAMPTRPLGLAELRITEQTLADMALAWSVELIGTSDDEANLVLLPDGGDDAMGPSFVVSRESFGFRLDQLHWDVMREIGTYAVLVEAIAAIRIRLAFNPGLADPVSLTLH